VTTSSIRYWISYDLSTPNGQGFRLKEEVDEEFFRRTNVHDRFTVVYDPSHPERCAIIGNHKRWFNACLFSGLGLFCLICGAVCEREGYRLS